MITTLLAWIVSHPWTLLTLAGVIALGGLAVWAVDRFLSYWERQEAVKAEARLERLDKIQQACTPRAAGFGSRRVG